MIRLVFAGVALALAAADWAFKAWAQQSLRGGRTIDIGTIDLQLAYNSGAAFGLGAGLPSWLVIAVTGTVTAGVALFAWRAAADGSWPLLAGLSAILAGAVANLADRTVDGVVTDYLHTGWWPTFNLADVFINIGAALAALSLLRSDTTRAKR